MIQLDPLAALVIVALTVLMAVGTRESSAFNMGESVCLGGEGRWWRGAGQGAKQRQCHMQMS